MRWLIALLILSSLVPVAGGQADGPLVLVADIDGVVTQGTTLHVKDAIGRAEREGAEALVLRLDTPGGLVDATIDIHQAIIASQVPVLTYVGPQGAFAASAGTLILMMGQPNGMAPTTTIGSAQPINVDPSGGSEPASEKVENFVIEIVEQIAERTGRNVTQAVRFVTDNDNLGPDEARDGDIIDIIAADLPSFVAGADGMTALTASGEVTLDTQGARIVQHDRGIVSQLVDLLGNPQISFLLILAGTYALVFGLANPGSYAPEVIGALLLILGFIGIGLFATSTAGVILLVLALLFFVAEVFTPTHGVLSVTGGIALVLAVVFLLREPLLPSGFLRTFYFAGLATAAVSVAAVMGAVTLALRARERPVFDAMAGARGVAIEPVGRDSGRVRVHEEIWNARSATAIESGRTIRVDGHRGITLDVSETDEEE